METRKVLRRTKTTRNSDQNIFGIPWSVLVQAKAAFRSASVAVQTQLQVSERMGKASNASGGDIRQTISKYSVSCAENRHFLCDCVYFVLLFMDIS
jgi:hypothetical protein